uniref:Nuclear transport factor 2 family protein n=1 Tax=Gongylonema pulchrum TaxID=637853 RepID=A0A183DHY8_9BILA
LFGNGDRIEYYARPARKSSDYATFPSTSGDWGRATLVRNGAIKRVNGYLAAAAAGA